MFQTPASSNAWLILVLLVGDLLESKLCQLTTKWFDLFELTDVFQKVFEDMHVNDQTLPITSPIDRKETSVCSHFPKLIWKHKLSIDILKVVQLSHSMTKESLLNRFNDLEFLRQRSFSWILWQRSLGSVYQWNSTRRTQSACRPFNFVSFFILRTNWAIRKKIKEKISEFDSKINIPFSVVLLYLISQSFEEMRDFWEIHQHLKKAFLSKFKQKVEIEIEQLLNKSN